MLPPLVYYVLIGGAIGGIAGYFGKCSSGSCPFTSTWRRGAFFGVMIGMAFWLTSGRASGPIDESGKNVKRITEKEFEAEVSKSALPVVMDFYATWCGPCKTLSPILDNLAGPLTNQVKFVKINVDEAPALAQRYHVEGIPMLLFFKNGKVVDSSVGLISREELAARLEFFANAKGTANFDRKNN